MTRKGMLAGVLMIGGLPALQEAPPQAESTKVMARRLEQLALDADAGANIVLNDRRVELIRQELVTIEDPWTRMTGRYLLARELVLSGRTEEGIAALTELREALTESRGDRAARLLADLEQLLGVAYWRLGERENRSLAGSVIPITEAGVHRDQDAARLAIVAFEGFLAAHPDNVTVRWLLNLAYMSVGEYPASVPDDFVVPESLFVSDYRLTPFVDRAAQLGLDVDGRAGGVVVEDLDGDFDLDILCSSWGLRDPMRLFRNNGDGTFTDQTAQSGLTGIVGGLNLVHGDYDNDGLPDVFVLRGAWMKEEGRFPNSLLKNRGGLRFDDVTEEAGLLSFHPTQTASWADFDGDGWLDLYVGNESEPDHRHPSELFHNNGNGTFSERAGELGLDVIGYVKAVVWGDYNNDGRPDLYVSRLGERNLLFRNDGPGEGRFWQFTESAASAGVTEPVVSFPAWFFDYDNDGFQDLFVSGYDIARGDFGIDYMELEHEAETARLYRNRGDGRFSDVTREVGLDRLFLTMGSNFGDLDSDGYLDFYLGTGDPDFRALVPNKMFRNAAGERFQDVTTSGGFGVIQKGHGVAFADIDGDGDQDVYEVLGGAYSGDTYPNVLFENPGNGNHWLRVSLEGTKSNRSAIGARVRVTVRTLEGHRDIHVTINTGGSFGSTSLTKLIGLGDASGVVALEILWPSGERQRLEDLALDQTLRLREGTGSEIR